MKKVLITVGAAAAAASIFATGVIAGPALENITVQLNHKLHFKLKGEAWTPEDSNGNIVAPITYNGTTYLPIRSAGEALGVKVGWDAATSTVLLGETDTAPPAAAGDVGHSRKNPAPLNTKVDFKVNDFTGNYSGKLSISEVIRGDDALDKIKAANPLNSKPDEGYEYILAKLDIEIDQTEKADVGIDLTATQFALVSTDGKEYDFQLVVPPNPSIGTTLYEGASHSGWAVFQVSKDDKNPVITFGRDFDGSGGVWLKTTK